MSSKKLLCSLCHRCLKDFSFKYSKFKQVNCWLPKVYLLALTVSDRTDQNTTSRMVSVSKALRNRDQLTPSVFWHFQCIITCNTIEGRYDFLISTWSWSSWFRKITKTWSPDLHFFSNQEILIFKLWFPDLDLISTWSWSDK